VNSSNRDTHKRMTMNSRTTRLRLCDHTCSQSKARSYVFPERQPRAVRRRRQPGRNFFYMDPESGICFTRLGRQLPQTRRCDHERVEVLRHLLESRRVGFLRETRSASSIVIAARRNIPGRSDTTVQAVHSSESQRLPRHIHIEISPG